MTTLLPWLLGAALCLPLHAAEFSGRVMVALDGKTIPVPNALVRVVSPISAPSDARPKPVLRLNRNTLTPPVLVVLAGEEFSIENKGPYLYNLHLQFRRNPEVNLGVLAGPGFVTHKRAEKPELFARISEDLGQVHGHVCVVENPVYALSGPESRFSLRLPAGTHTIEAAHQRHGIWRQQITITDKDMSAEILLAK